MMQATSESDAPPHTSGTVVSYRVDAFRDEWIIPEEPVPESAWHDLCLELVKALLVAWVERTKRDAAVFRDIPVLARRENGRIGFNPDVCLVEPAPEGAAMLESMKLWEHSAPRLAFEAVSPHHPYKDYAIIPEKCAVTGVEELIVFDPVLAGPTAQGGPWLLQVWRRSASGVFERVYAGTGPARSRVLDAWLHPDGEARRLRVAEREEGGGRWLTKEEIAEEKAQRASAELERASAELERASAAAESEIARATAREAAALARVRELEAELQRRRGG